ncbi:Hsp33 family molecular chaperone HslO [Fodinibius sediminis]|uniref:33 kDa chaperonin n=1 Tax=Fodinibius sediminis TaxID=1214077 RepID=A0A521AJF7_9BACT|nr:Hsp33 family molecular chaperone HslO [Fodinibius sediminis]SMO34942.1 molecular chaperone Hsp33 [Fodinibius sediminis]
MISKEDFAQKDRLIKGISAHGDIKISVVKTTDVVRTARKKHNLSLLNTVLLGRALTATMLMASELKGEERIQMRLEGKGPVGLLVAEANRVGEIRGYVQNPEVELNYSDDQTSLGDGLGVGVLSVRKTLYNEAEPRTSSIELVKGNVTDDVAYYMVQSEQVPSAVLLDVGLDDQGAITEAGGVLVQRMPDAPEGRIDEIQQKMLHFDPVSELLAGGYYIDDIMAKIMEPDPVKELDRQPVDFFCRCTRNRFISALAMLGPEDLQEISDEGQELVCHFCNEQYQVSKSEIKELLMQTKAKMN